MFKIKKVNMPRVGFFLIQTCQLFLVGTKLEIDFVYSIHAHKDIDVYMNEACYGM